MATGFEGMFGIMFASAIAMGILLAHRGPEGACMMPSYPPPKDLYGAGLVTCCFFVVWYIMLGNQVGTRFAQQPPKNAAECKDIADRCVGNIIEQGVPFLGLLWLQAMFINPLTAKVLGAIYVVTRYLYPIMFGINGEFNLTLISFSTQPGYIINFYFLVTAFYKFATGGADLHTEVHKTSPWLMIPVMIACGLACVVSLLGLAAPTTKIIINGVENNQDEYDDDLE